MPNLKNAKKKVNSNIKKTKVNNEYAEEKLKVAIKTIDKAKKNGVTSKNTSARNKSRLTKKVNSME